MRRLADGPLRRLLGGEAQPYAAAVGAALGAWLLAPVPWPVALAAAAAWVWRPSPVTVGAAFLAAASLLGARAEAGLVAPDAGPVQGWVTLLDDPRPLGPSGVRVTVGHQGKRIEATAHGRASRRLNDALAGERVEITGTLRAAEGADHWQRSRHVVGEMTLTAVGDRAPAAPLPGLANRIRRLLASGASGLGDDDRSLFTGMVFGDDRDQSPRLADDFRAAGLGHVLVVSGQNVAFVLALAAPLAARLRPGTRLVALGAVLGVFAVITRFEPSVLRAVTMAAAAVVSAALGRPLQGLRTLAWAVAVVLVVDPFVLRVLAFQLSVCATAGILVLAPPIAAALPGPHPLRLAVATTAGAQVAVMPLLVAVFGSVPVASLPANVVAAPAAGPVMMWGLTGGVAAGALGGWAAWLIHRPTAVALWWVRTVASAAALAPPAAIGAAGALAVGAGVLLALRSPRAVRVTGVIVVTVTLGWSVAAAPVPPQGWSEAQGASVFAHRGAVVVVLDNPWSTRGLLESLRTAGVRRIDLVVAARGGSRDAHAAVALVDRYGPMPVLAPPGHRVPRARSTESGSVIAVSGLLVEATAHHPELKVQIRPSSRAESRSSRGRRGMPTKGNPGRLPRQGRFRGLQPPP